MTNLYKNTSFSKEDIQLKKTKTSNDNWGTDHPMQSQAVKDKMKHLCMEKYGVDNPSKDPDIIEKIRQTSIKKYGVDNPSKDPAIIERIRQQAKERWGDEEKKAQMLAKRKATNLAKYGVEWNSQRPEHSLLSKVTSRNRYGTEWPMQNDAVHDKSSRNSRLNKEYVFPSGRKDKVQGYEHWAVDLLLKSYHEDQIVLLRGLKPRIKYIFYDKASIYKADIYIPSENLLIEVKSTYTYNKELDRNLAKRQASIDAGYNFRFMIFNSHGVLLHDN